MFPRRAAPPGGPARPRGVQRSGEPTLAQHAAITPPSTMWAMPNPGKRDGTTSRERRDAALAKLRAATGFREAEPHERVPEGETRVILLGDHSSDSEADAKG